MYTHFIFISPCGLQLIQPISPVNVEENLLRNLIDPSAASSTIIETEEPSRYWEDEGPFLDGNKSLESIDVSLHVGPDAGSKSASDNKVAMLQNIHSNSNPEKAGEV